MTPAGAEVLLRGTQITRRWGGLVAVNDVSLALQRGAVHAVIGTNGAGKSTLVNILSGEIAPSAGRVELLGQDVTAWPQPRREAAVLVDREGRIDGVALVAAAEAGAGASSRAAGAASSPSTGCRSSSNAAPCMP